MKRFESYLELLAWAIRQPVTGEFSAIFWFCDGYSRSTFMPRYSGPRHVLSGLKAIESHIAEVTA